MPRPKFEIGRAGGDNVMSTSGKRDQSAWNVRDVQDGSDESKSSVPSLLNNETMSSVMSAVSSSVNSDLVNGLIGSLGQNIGGVLQSMSQHPLLQDDTNRGWLLVGGAFLGVFFLISILWQFIFSFMLSYASIKVMLWFLEHYAPDENSNEVVGDHYVSESSPVDVIEYLVVLITMAAMTPLAYFPYMSLLVNGGCVVLSVLTMANKEHRRRVCVTVKNMLVAPDYRPNVGMEGRIHSSLQTFCYTIESLNLGTFNIANDGRAVYSDLKTSESFAAGLRRLTSRSVRMLKNKATNPGKGNDEDTHERDHGYGDMRNY